MGLRWSKAFSDDQISIWLKFAFVGSARIVNKKKNLMFYIIFNFLDNISPYARPTSC